MPLKCFYDISRVQENDRNEYPGFFAKFFDLIYSSIDTGLDEESYLKRIARTNGKILEAGAGTGRLFIEALKTGADIYGIDISPAMVEKLRSKLDGKDQGRVILKDIRDMNLNVTFDLIIAPFRVFMHVIETEDQLKALYCVYKHLNPGGLFIFDVFIPDPEILLKGINEQKDFEGEYEPGRKVTRIASSKADPLRQINEVNMRLEWDEGGVLNSDSWNVKMRYFYRYELENLIARSPLKLVDIYGDSEGRELTSDSKNFVVVCKKEF